VISVTFNHKDGKRVLYQTGCGYKNLIPTFLQVLFGWAIESQKRGVVNAEHVTNRNTHTHTSVPEKTEVKITSARQKRKIGIILKCNSKKYQVT